MNLTEQQRDALVELANIGVSRAATQLSQLLNETIKMNVPEVAVVKLDNLGIHFRYLDEEKVVVYQDMSGCLEGRAHLVFELEECGSLIQLLLGSLSISEDVDLRSYEHEALTELANIVITTCIVTLAGALGDEILLTVPTYGRPLLSKEFFGTRGADEDQVLILKTELMVLNRSVSGSVMLVLSLKAMHQITDMLDRVFETHKQLGSV